MKTFKVVLSVKYKIKGSSVKLSEKHQFFGRSLPLPILNKDYPPNTVTPGEEKSTYTPDVKISREVISVDGVNILNFDLSLDWEEREMLASYLASVYKIRRTGNDPFVIDTYDEKEQRAILKFQKEYRKGL